MESSTGNQTMEVLRGQVTGPQENQSSMVRVFISSTFTDMSSERKALLEKAYPEVHAFCRGLGLVFEVVDLRWGIRNITSGDHLASDLFLEQIEACKRRSVGPAFVVLLGNRYGHRALPRLIPEKEFEMLLSKLSKNPEGLKLLNQWFLKDNNAVPPAYTLQPITAHFPHYSDLRPESGPQRDSNVVSWRFTETKLLRLLRTAATEAEADGDITAEQKQNFYRSVTECEIKEGLWKKDGESPALLFIRELARQRLRDGPKRLAKFMDLTADGLLDAEAQELLTGLKLRLYNTSQKILNLHCVELSKGAIDPKRKEHAQYLESLCEQFVSQMKARISRVIESPGGGKQRKTWGSIKEEKEEISEWVLEEVGRHAALSAELCRGLLAREGLLGKLCLAMWESTNAHHGPLVVHGAAGMGKTALLCKLAQEMRNVLEPGAVVVIRLLSACHPLSPDIDHVLRSVTFQICLACGLMPPAPLTANTHVELVRFFQNLLAKVSEQGNTLLILLDSLDQLSEEHHAHKLHWLPTDIPPNVHLVVSTNTNSQVFASLRLKLETLTNFFEVERLSCDEGKEIMDSYMRASQRTLTTEQSDAVLRSFEQTGSPLHLKMILSAAKHWTSLTPLSELCLGANPQEVMSLLLLSLEEKHGKKLVAAALGYIALARAGLLEAELRDVMSLDDDVISEVYRYSLPPNPSVIQLPPLLWARLRRDLGENLEEQWVDGVVMIGFRTRQLCEAVTVCYLTAEHRGQRLRILADYFLGRWSGKLKPLALPALSLLVSDRKVPPQPLWFAPGLANLRKLQELPYHLLHAGLWEELRQNVIGSAEWLYCKSRICGVASVIQDLNQCSQYMDCIETRLVRDALLLIKPSLDFLDGQMDMCLFYTELLGRLLALAPPYPSVIGRLCSQCEEWLLACPEPILVPKCSFLQSPGGALLHTLTGLQRGVVCLDVGLETELMVTGSDDGLVMAWNLADRQLIHTLLGHTAAVLSVKVIDSCVHCLSLAADGSLRRWSLLTGRQLFCIQEAVPVDSSPSSVHLHLSEQKHLVFVYTETQVSVPGLLDLQVRSWRLDSAELLFSISDSRLLILGVLEESVFCLSDGLVRIFHPANGAKTVETRLENSQRSCERTLSIFHIEMDSLDRFLDLQHDDSVLSACISKDSRLLVSGAADHVIRVWSVTTGVLLDSLCGMEAPISSLALCDGFIVSASTAADCIQLWGLKYDARHKPRAHIPTGCPHVALTKDCDMVYYVRQERQREVICWNNHTGSSSDSMAVSGEVCCLELAQHKRLLFCGLKTGTIFIYPLASPQETLCIPPPESLPRVCCMAVGPREKHMAVAYEDSVCLFEITARDSFPTVEGPLKKFPLSLLHSLVSSMALLDDCRLLYGTGCGEVNLHNFTSSSTSSLEPHRTRVTCVTASNWGTHALVGSEDTVQRLWALNPLALDHTMEYKGFFFEGVLSAAFSESDQFVFTGSQDRTVKVWDVATGNLLYVQYVYAAVIKMVTYRNGFVALSQQGHLIKEVFRCPEHISPEYNPLRNVKAQYRVTSREKNQDSIQTSTSDLQSYNPAQFNLNFMSMLKNKPTTTCDIL
ncbi:NACHT domain- and WD repeat-containing protein 1 [Diretmus argenteus]